MIDQKKLAGFWDQNVSDEFKHFMDSAFQAKVEKYRADVKRYLIDGIEFEDIGIALDWGCGGGLGALLLSERCDVVALDVAVSSLQKCKEFLGKQGKKLRGLYKLDNIEDLVINERIDLVFSVSVVQHFPSYEYWKKVVTHWKSLQPGWIAVQTRHGDENKSNEEIYFDDRRNYILGLYLTTEEVIGSLDDSYKLKCHRLIDDNYSMYEYFVFRNSGQL